MVNDGRKFKRMYQELRETNRELKESCKQTEKAQNSQKKLTKAPKRSLISQDFQKERKKKLKYPQKVQPELHHQWHPFVLRITVTALHGVPSAVVSGV